MSQYGEVDEKSGKMAISYASGLPADHTQTLPSFRELLPPHLHDEIESGSYLSRQPPSHERPLSAHHEFGSVSRPYGSPSKFGMGDARDYSMTGSRIGESHHSMLAECPPMQGQLPANATQEATGRGPSPILPSIRDLPSFPDRTLAASATGLPEHRGPPRSEAFVAPGYIGTVGQVPPVYRPNRLSGPVGERRGGDSYPTNGMPAVIHTQSPYSPYPAMIYQSDSEQASSQLLPPAQLPNFGILGESVDSKNKRRRGNLPKPVTDILRAWFHDHLDHPYPSEEDKQMFMTRTGLTISQISNWFINARRRQLPALRNQMRNGTSNLDSQRQSPFSDIEQISADSMPSPHRFNSSNKH